MDQAFEQLLVCSSNGVVLWRWKSAPVKYGDYVYYADNVQANDRRLEVLNSGDLTAIARYSSEALNAEAWPYLQFCYVQVLLKKLIDQFIATGPVLQVSDEWIANTYAAAKLESKQQQATEEDKNSRVAVPAEPWLTRFGKRIRDGMFNLLGSQTVVYPSLALILDNTASQLRYRNVAESTTLQICDEVRRRFEAKKLEYTKKNLRSVLEAVLADILRPARQVDLLAELQRSHLAKRVYSIVIMGTNGVGKSTTLAKLAYHLRSRLTLRVMIAACDTFRSGAVEQLQKHCSNLELDLFQKGYGMEPAAVAVAALNRAKELGVDLLLIDTAGRMQDNVPLMKSLGTLAASVRPDLCLFVGEALVGNDCLDQIAKFDKHLAVSKRADGTTQSIDGIILTKFDTVDDKIGAAISLSHESKKPVYYVGTGQTYSDLRVLHVPDIVSALLSS